MPGAGIGRRLRRRLVALLGVLAGLPGLGHGAAAFEPWPDTDYDPAIPRLEAVLGHDFGADITAPEDLRRYLEALTAAAPARTRLVEYARSWEGRPLHYLVISSAAHLARLDDIRAGMQRLADPRGATAAELDALVESLPASVWLAHGVHGDEISSADAALVSAYHLLAARDPAVSAWLDDTVVIIDPAQNPDGRARFVQHYRATRGLVPQPSPIAAERAQGWPGGRYNHYLFDMNRDWFALTQPEVAGRVQAFLEYFPLVHADVHEMGTDASYYFPPPAVPWNPFLTAAQRATLSTLGQGIAASFDRFGFRYFTREVYDAYYPGYGDTWPALHGAAGMTFEMASARGLLGQRSDGSLVSYADGVRRHFVANMATVGTAAAERRRLLEDFLAFRRGPDDRRVFVLPRRRDPGRVDDLARLLTRQGIEVHRLAAAVRMCGEPVPPGSYAVAAAQPAGRLASTLLQADSPAAADFWAEQERRAAKRLPVAVYDVVGWSLPLLHDVDVLACEASVAGYPRFRAEDLPVPAVPADAGVAYLVAWGTRAAARLLSGALRAGLEPYVATRAFEHGGQRYPRGSLILYRDDPAVGPTLARLVEETGAAVSAADRSWVSSGIDFGSERSLAMTAPHVALAWDAPTEPTSAGAWRYLVERKLDYPVAPVRVRDLDSRWLDQFDVLVLPEGDGWGAHLGAETVDNLRRWIERGGTLIAVGSALEHLAGVEPPLLASSPEWRVRQAEDEAPPAPGENPEVADDVGEASREAAQALVPGTVLADEAALTAALTPAEERPRAIPGVLVRGVVDPDHWLGAGLPERLPLMLTGDRIFTPLRLDAGTNVVRFVDAAELAAGGRLWTDAAAQLARKPAVVAQAHGRGQLIGFVTDPAFRGMLDGLDVLVANALLLGPAIADPVPEPPPVR